MKFCIGCVGFLSLVLSMAAQTSGSTGSTAQLPRLVKFSGTLPKSKTRWVASYRYNCGHALTPVDLFNTSAGQSDPYLNLFIRQPIPASFLAGHMEILVDLRNLLAEGYVPVMGQDGHTLYLVQSARSVRGGVAFSF